jgi:Skp family chaperone for outer membrane proteins
MFMRSPKMLPNLALLIAGASIALGAGVLATRSGPVAPVVAVVDVKKVLQGLDERKAKAAELEKSLSELKARNKQLEEERSADETKIKAMATGPAKTTALKAYRDKYFRGSVDREFGERLLAEDEVTMLRNLYLKIDAAAGDLAKKNGYQLVLASDEKLDIPGPPQANIEQLTQAINLKRMLYVAPEQPVPGRWRGRAPGQSLISALIIAQLTPIRRASRDRRNRSG